MLKHELWKASSIEYAGTMIVRDPDGLWQRSGIDALTAAAGFITHRAADSIALRYLYEKNILIDGEKCVILYEGSFMPYDIERAVAVFDASYAGFYRNLDTAVLCSFRNINHDLLSLAYRDVYYPLSADDTEDLCCGKMWNPEYVGRVCEAYRADCDALIERDSTRETYLTVAHRLGFLLYAQRMGVGIAGFDAWYDSISARFAEWMRTDYRYLAQTPTGKQPFIMSQVQDYIRRNASGKVALIVMDGMSYTDYHMILRDMARSRLSMKTTSLFSFVPSITSVARQSLFSGKLPAEHPKPFDLSNEEKQFRRYWLDNGVKDSEIFFAKSEEAEWPERTRVAGIVVNIIDDLMHAELQGNKGMYSSLSTWLENGNLAQLLARLHDDGFTIYMTADHGNTSAVAQGRFQKPSVIMENASRRAAIYQAFAGAEELDKFAVTEYTGPYMPKDYRYFAFDPHACYGDRGTEYISHGGMTIEEMIVPFVRIGE